jgi:hypothetical protein
MPEQVPPEEEDEPTQFHQEMDVDANMSDV